MKKHVWQGFEKRQIKGQIYIMRIIVELAVITTLAYAPFSPRASALAAGGK